MAKVDKISEQYNGSGLFLAALPVLILLIVELLAISFFYNHSFEFECRAMASAAFCGFLSAGVMRAISVGAATAIFCMVRPDAFQHLLQALRAGMRPSWLLVQGIGFLLVLAPWLFLNDGSSSLTFAIAVMMWIVGAGAAVLGAALTLIPWSTWVAACRMAGPAALLVFVLALAGPELAGLAQASWAYEPVTDFTFWSVHNVLAAFGYDVVSDAPSKLLAVGEFAVLVGKQCSGVEGFGLITAFTLLYIGLFRTELNVTRALLLLPIGIVLSWLLNVVRIAILIMIGHHVSPDLAVNGFHSHAGWLMFTLLSLGLAVSAHQVRWFRRDEKGAPRMARADRRSAQQPFFSDPVAAQLFPFIIFMATALLSSTFLEIPSLAYPLRAAAVAIALALFWPVLRRMDWRADPVAIVAGLGVGLAWLATAPAAQGADTALSDALAALPFWALVIWIATRVLGTVLLVPVVEELVFRGYILRRIGTGTLLRTLVAVLISSVLFAVLHDRWLAAALAGIVFGAIMLRNGNLCDAIVSHGVANTVIATQALMHNNWALI